jgi:uncharacterized protein YkwD
MEMRKSISLSVRVVMMALALIASLAPETYPAQSGGVFVGRGRVAHPRNRDSRPPDYGDSQPESRSATGRDAADDELKPMVAGRRLRQIESLEQQCFDEINRVRAASGLPPLAFSEELLGVAREYSRRMAEENFFSHSDPEGGTVRQRVDRANIRWRVVGENLAYSNGYTNPVAASMHGWMESPGHRRNILDTQYDLTAVGAWISSDGTVYFTEIFLKQ